MTNVRARSVVVELGAMTLLLLSYIWLWQGAFEGSFVLCCALYAAFGVLSHARRGESMRDIGFRSDNLARASLQALVFVGPLVLVPPVLGLALGTLDFPAPSRWLPRLGGSIVWATAQQYGLLCFFLRRFSDVLPGRQIPILASAGVFALFHVPNPFLVPVTMALGALSCWLYLRVPNVLVLGVAHGVLSVVIGRSLPVGVTFGQRVGPGFWTLWERCSSGAALF